MAETDQPQAQTPTGNPIEPGTTRDALDLGVPMLPGSPNEPQGPEDALGVGPKRGDYRDRIGPAHYHPHTTVQQADGTLVAEPQRPRAEEIGDVPGVKGGVGTDPALAGSWAAAPGVSVAAGQVATSAPPEADAPEAPADAPPTLGTARAEADRKAGQQRQQGGK